MTGWADGYIGRAPDPGRRGDRGYQDAYLEGRRRRLADELTAQRAARPTSSAVAKSPHLPGKSSAAEARGA